MVHKLERFKSAYNQAEKFWYEATGLMQGITSGKTARDLQDYYIGSKKVRFQKPGFNLRKFEKYYQNRYHPYKRRFKGDIVIDASSNTQPETLRTTEPFKRRNSSFSIIRHLSSGSKYSSKRRRRNNRRKQCSCSFCRNVVARQFKRW